MSDSSYSAYSASPVSGGDAQLAASAINAPASPRVRLWPGILIVVAQWLAILIPAITAPATIEKFMAMMWAPMIAGLLFIIWWIFASRIPWRERGIALGACVAIGTVVFFLWDKSLNWMSLIMYAIPGVTTVWVLWLAFSGGMQWPARRAGLIVSYVLVFAALATLRFEGVDGSFSAELAFRWQTSAEEEFLKELAARDKDQDTAAEAPPGDVPPLELQPGDFPGFRGPLRDGRLRGVTIRTDWSARPLKELWRRRVGPGWGSFSVVGNRLFTQEQHGEDEVVVCYNADTGEPMWTHRDVARFTEVVAGPGPRATPTFHEGKIYSQGAAGKLNCLDALTGRCFWSRDIGMDSGAPTPMWGFAASPLVVNDVVTVFAGGPDGKCVLGYHIATGEPAWTADAGENSYSSTHSANIDGVEQILMVTDRGLTAVEPATGKPLWEHVWQLEEGMSRVIQPTLVGDRDLLLGMTFGVGTRRLHLAKGGDAWTVDEMWTETDIKPYFNDMVPHKGALFGIDGNVFVCVGLVDGKRKWRARGYGAGQVLLLADQDLLLILAESGEVALVEATPDRHNEVARFKAIEGKTWNHPVIAHGKLFVRNGEEAACFDVAE